MALSFSDFMRIQLWTEIPKPSTSFASKTVIITGASSGLGLEAVEHLVALNAAKEILTCRNTKKSAGAKLAVEEATKCDPSVLKVWPLDLDSYESIRQFVAKADGLERLDVLVCNAGAQSTEFETLNGTEVAISVNVISTFLLAFLLTPKLQRTAKEHGVVPTLTFTTSALYSAAKMPPKQDDIFAWLGEKQNVNIMNQYNLSKLFQVFVIRKLATLVSPTTATQAPESASTNPRTINSLDPCFCKTDLARNLTGGLKIFFKTFEFLFARTAEEGARCIAIAAGSGRETHGGCMRSGRLREYAPRMLEGEKEGYGNNIWEQVRRKMEMIEPGIMAGLGL